MLAPTYFTGSAWSSLGSTEALFELFLLLPMQLDHLGNLFLRAGENPVLAKLSVSQSSRLPSGCPPDLLFSVHFLGCCLSRTYTIISQDSLRLCFLGWPDFLGFKGSFGSGERICPTPILETGQSASWFLCGYSLEAAAIWFECGSEIPLLKMCLRSKGLLSAQVLFLFRWKSWELVCKVLPGVAPDIYVVAHFILMLQYNIWQPGSSLNSWSCFPRYNCFWIKTR